MRVCTSALVLLGLTACGTEPPSDEPDPVSTQDCVYPSDPVEPMALDEVLFPYSWPTALHADGRSTPIDLDDVPCATDEVIDWSMHDMLLFVSIPAW